MTPTSPKNPPHREHLISREILAFIIDRRARKRSDRTIQYYEDELRYFSDWLQPRNITTIEAITSQTIREYLIDLSERRNKGGIHASFRAIKAFLNWWELEIDDPTFRNPIKRVEAPTPSREPLPGITRQHVHALLTACFSRNGNAARDRAIIYFLIDTGVRKTEMTNLSLGDVDLKTGAVIVREGKGDKRRTVILGNRARRELLRYLRLRSGDLLPHLPLWTTETGERLTPSGLRQIIRRRAEQAGIPEPGMHDFRRYFAIESLRNGMDLETLRRLMGHTTMSVLQRYLHLVEDDLHRGHGAASPGDNL